MFQQRRAVAPDSAARDIGGRNTHPGFIFVSTEKRNNLSGIRIYILLENPVIDLRETLVRLLEMLTGGMGTEPVETAGLRPSATAAHRLAVITLDAEINRTGTSAATVVQGCFHHRKNGLLYLLSGHIQSGLSHDSFAFRVFKILANNHNKVDQGPDAKTT